MPVLYAIAVSTALVCLALLLVLGSLRRTGLPGIREWMAANAAVLVSMPLFGLRGYVPDFLSIVLANAVLAFAPAFYYAGCARFMGHRVPWGWMGCAIALTMGAGMVWLYYIDDARIRSLIFSTYAGLMLFAVAVLVYRRHPPFGDRHAYLFTAVVATVFSASMLARGWYALSVPAADSIELFSGVWTMALLVVGAVLMPGLTMGAIMMVHGAVLAHAHEVANRDHVTGALTRKRFEALAEEHIQQASIEKRPLSLLLVDLDHFKRINDSLGHAAGDTVLREFVRVARVALREGDILGRVGGEEFAVLMPGADAKLAQYLGDRLRMAVEADPARGSFGRCSYTISGGVACWTEGESFEWLSIRADRSLYQAKRSGRNRIHPELPLLDVASAQVA